jgi:proline iminopeptidase
LFDPARFRVIVPDQRGAGRSEPMGATAANTTAHLLADIDVIRAALGLKRCFVAGGSWGATLGILYAARRPAQVSGLLLRNPFLARAADLAWFFGGARLRHPEAWRRWAALGAPEADGAMLPWLAEVFAKLDVRQAGPWVQAWQRWECALAGVPAGGTLGEAEVAALFRRYRLQLHYFTQGCFVPPDAVLEAIDQLVAAQVPLQLVQGLADDVCPAAATRLLAARLPAEACRWVEGVGHDPFAPAMVAASMAAWAELSGEKACGR